MSVEVFRSCTKGATRLGLLPGLPECAYICLSSETSLFLFLTKYFVIVASHCRNFRLQIRLYRLPYSGHKTSLICAVCDVRYSNCNVHIYVKLNFMLTGFLPKRAYVSIQKDGRFRYDYAIVKEKRDHCHKKD